MPAKRRLQLEIDSQDSLVLDALKEDTNSTITEVIRNSLALYDWAVHENKEKRLVLSVPETPKDQNVTKPILKGINNFRD